MATNFRKAAFEQTWSAVDGNITGLTLYDLVPFEPEGAPDTNFPYAVLNTGQQTPWEDDDTEGVFVDVEFDVYARSLSGQTDMNSYLDSLYGILNRASMSATGYSFVDVLFEFADSFLMDDGKTRQGAARYRIKLMEA